MQVTVELNKFELDRLRRNLENTHKCVGLTTQWLVWDNMRLAMQDAIKYTAPWAAGKPGTSKAQQLQGQSAVNNDVERIFATKDESKYVFFVNAGNNKQFARDKKSGAVFEISGELMNPDIQPLHLRLRNNRGRVNKQKRQAWVQAKPLQDYIKTVQSRVGSLKASWVPALEYFASKVGGAMRVPAWIAKQNKEGTFQDRVNASGNGAAVATSVAHHGVGIRRDTIQFIERQRNKFMQGMTQKRMEQIAKSFKAGTVQPKAITA
jgi:hypothetical protein